jgi:choline dehydrogenase
MSEREYDYVIIGGGTAGCILATRLTDDPAVRVLLLEAGSKGGSWKVRMPSAYDYLFKNPQFNWCYQGEPEPHLNGRRMYQPRGKVLGGSSGINGLGFIRGHPLDFERWVRQGATGWSYREVLPYFRRSETWDGGADLYRGADGPVRVTTGTCEEPLYRAFLEAGRQAGYASSDDLNGAAPEGFGAFQTNIDHGIRASTAHAYLRLARGRGNLKIETAARAQRILVEGNRTVGVAYACEGERREARASREVILCGGSFNSPQMLMLSGIGPADELKRLDIKVAVDLPGVGQNLQDHAAAYMQYECPEPLSVTKYLRPDRKLMMGLQWFLFQKGPAAGNNLETVALLRSDPSVPHPDIEIQNLAVVFDHDGGIHRAKHGFTYCIGPTRAEGSGWVKLKSGNPDDPPRILCNFLSTPADWHVMRESIRIGREVAFQTAYDRYRSREISPGPHVKTNAEIDEYLRGATVNDFHPTGTCRMGSDRMAVVDATLKVHGIEGLRVVDASVMPSTVSANTNATTIMIGEKAADLVRGCPPLPPAVVPLPGGTARAEAGSA